MKRPRLKKSTAVNISGKKRDVNQTTQAEAENVYPPKDKIYVIPQKPIKTSKA